MSWSLIPVALRRKDSRCRLSGGVFPPAIRGLDHSDTSTNNSYEFRRQLPRAARHHCESGATRRQRLVEVLQVTGPTAAGEALPTQP